MVWNDISPATSPPAWIPTRIRSGTWRSLRISLEITVCGLTARLEEVSRIALNAGVAGVTPKVVSRTLAMATRFVDWSGIGEPPSGEEIEVIGNGRRNHKLADAIIRFVFHAWAGRVAGHAGELLAAEDSAQLVDPACVLA
jgi:hypothetical protein